MGMFLLVGLGDDYIVLVYSGSSRILRTATLVTGPRLNGFGETEAYWAAVTAAHSAGATAPRSAGGMGA
jgi:hypothetical protein